METKFQTSFIPKKPVMPVGGLSVPKPHHPISSLFMTIATLLFLVSLAMVGGAYYWKTIELNTQEKYKTDLAAREKQLDQDFRLLEDIKKQTVKINLAQSLLNNHIALSQIFDIVGRMTTEQVRFLNLDVSVGNPGEGVKISMRGYGLDFLAVAFQSDVLGKLQEYNLRNIVKNPIMTDPALDAKGTVSFGFSATVDPSALSFRKSLRASVSNSGTSDTNSTQ